MIETILQFVLTPWGLVATMFAIIFFFEFLAWLFVASKNGQNTED